MIDAQKILSDEGIASGIILVEKLAPYEDILAEISSLLKGAKSVLFVEEGIKNGGFSMICSNAFYEKNTIGCDTKIAIRAIDDNFANPDKKCDIYEYLGFSPIQLAEEIKGLQAKD